MKKTLILIALLAFVAAPLARAQVENVIPRDTIANSGTMKGTRILGSYTIGGSDSHSLIISASDSINMRLRLIAVGMFRNIDKEFSADTINLGWLTSTTAKQWRFEIDTLTRGTAKNQAGATAQTAWNAWPYKVYVELLPRASANAVQGGTSTVKWVQVDVRKRAGRSVFETVFVDTLQNSGTLKGSKIIGGAIGIAGIDSMHFIGSVSDSSTGYWRAVAYNWIGYGSGVRIAADTVFIRNTTTVAAGQQRINWAQLKVILGSNWYALPPIMGIEYIPEASGNCELPVGGVTGLQPKWVKVELEMFYHRQ